MPQKQERTLPGDVDNIKTRRTLRQPSEPTINKIDSWVPRFWAWFIDIVVVAVVLTALVPISSADAVPLRIGMTFGALILYWSFFDSNGRQSLGKKTVSIKLAEKNGNDATLSQAFVSALGKSIILPADILIGILIRPGEGLRLFNIASDTIVVQAR